MNNIDDDNLRDTMINCTETSPMVKKVNLLIVPLLLALAEACKSSCKLLLL